MAGALWNRAGVLASVGAGYSICDWPGAQIPDSWWRELADHLRTPGGFRAHQRGRRDMVHRAADALQPLEQSKVADFRGHLDHDTHLSGAHVPDRVRPDTDRYLRGRRTGEYGPPGSRDCATQRGTLQVTARGVAPADRAAFHVQHAQFHRGPGARPSKRRRGEYDRRAQ